MATILLSAAGAAIGGSVGGTLAGLSSAAVGRAVGATLGRAIDERILGAGAAPVETGRVDRFRLTNAGEGGPVAQVFGRMRVGGQVIWASDFAETASVSGGGKGAPAQPRTTAYSYSVSLAVALCEGVIADVGRVWADGEELPLGEINMRVYPGDETQQPDPLIEAVEGAGQVPAYRGTAYVVIEDLALERFGNRVPQFSFEVVRPDQDGAEPGLSELVRAVAMMPGTGEYALATTPVYYTDGPGSQWPANLNSPSAGTDFARSVAQLEGELPEARATSLVVSWFGGDLRCGMCRLRPKVEKKGREGSNMPWQVSGLTRVTADEIAQRDGRPIYGGTPADASVVEAIRHLRAKGQAVMFYPFILMDQQAGNDLPDPWTGAEGQPALPWRGRITCSAAPGREGSPDGTDAAREEVAAFIGTVRPEHFVLRDGAVSYTGPEEWSLRRFILHYAALCAAAGGVEAFCISSEMRGLTQIRGASGFPAVAALRDLAADVRALLGPETKIGYAADWSEYWGYAPQDGSGDRYFHLDPLWADPQIDFIGIDNYMPLSDWRDGEDHLDAEWGGIHDPDYLAANIEGGEGSDWYYHSDEARAAQIRTPITDGAHGEPWIWRNKDLRSWWEREHHERIGGVRRSLPTEWVPRSKPFWFTELGCAAVDKGTNQPNRFLDTMSSESGLPHFSTGQRDDLIQIRYVQAMMSYWAEPACNPVSEVYGGPMIDLERAFVWAWDARPFPAFPVDRGLWSDGANHARGHWITGRSGTRTLASVVREICRRAGLDAVDVSGLRGIVRGYVVDDVADARAALQPLMLAYGFDAVERGGLLRFVMRGAGAPVTLDPGRLAVLPEMDGPVERLRAAEAEMSGRVRLRFVQAEADHAVVAEEAVLPDDRGGGAAASELALALTRAEGRQVADRWLAEARLARDGARLALPPSLLHLGPGDVLRLPAAAGGSALYRVDRAEQAEAQILDAVRIDPAVHLPGPAADDVPPPRAFAAPVPVVPLFLDLPLMSGDEVPHAPHLALTGTPWPGSVAVYGSGIDGDYALEEVIAARASVGLIETALSRGPAGRWEGGPGLQVRMLSGRLESRSRGQVLNGANLSAIGDGSGGNWELIQFADAELIGPQTWLLRNRLRGQAGSDGVAPDVWPAGS